LRISFLSSSDIIRRVYFVFYVIYQFR
jgi:hypothetical protein